MFLHKILLNVDSQSLINSTIKEECYDLQLRLLTHEFKNLLQKILLFLETDKPIEEVQELVLFSNKIIDIISQDLFVHNSTTLQGIFSEVESFFEKTEGKLSFSITPADNTNSHKSNKIIIDFPNVVKTILQNIIVNCLKHAKPATCQVIWSIEKSNVKGKETKLTIKVIDFGPGISPAKRAKILNPFTTLQKGVRGMGRGLFLVDNLAKVIGADFFIDSRIKSDYKKGTVFTLVIYPRNN